MTPRNKSSKVQVDVKERGSISFKPLIVMMAEVNRKRPTEEYNPMLYRSMSLFICATFKTRVDLSISHE